MDLLSAFQPEDIQAFADDINNGLKISAAIRQFMSQHELDDMDRALLQELINIAYADIDMSSCSFYITDANYPNGPSMSDDQFDELILSAWQETNS